ncbi:hypothetical protein F4782DRAFT_38243 [Xylaria castorea]|nr:hypothetical protein F4782DRAFT_38243 [Xylaria castorea]
MYFGRRVATGVSTPSVQPIDPASRPLFVIQGQVAGTTGVMTCYPSGQDVEARLAAAGNIDYDMLPLVSTGSQSQSQSQHQPPTFLNLPFEIRLEIYAYLLTTPSYSPRSPPPSTPSSSSSPSPAPFFLQQNPPYPLFHPHILRTCRQLHAEGIPVLYGSNTFLAHTSLLTTFPSFFSFFRPGPGHSSSSYAPIRSASLASLVTRYRVRLRLDAEPQFGRDEATAQFSGKTEVVVEAWQAEWRGAGPDALRLFEGVRGVKTARVTGSTGGFEPYAHWLECAMMAGIGDYVEPFAWEDGACGMID